MKAADAASKYLKLEVGGVFEGIYIDVEEKYSEKYKKTSYAFKFDIDGVEKILNTSSAKVLRKMAVIEPNTLLRVTRLGVDNKTDYSFEEITRKKKKKKSLVAGTKKKKKKKKKKGLAL